MRHFIVSVPESVLQDAKGVAEFQSESDEYFLQRVIETMSISVGQPNGEYTDIYVSLATKVRYVIARFLSHEDLIEICPDLTPADAELLEKIIEQLGR